MDFKDYYSILGLKPSATIPEIKKAYRHLALRHHPDKTGNDPYAAAQFTEIKEAYEVLTNPGRKQLYLQQRWYRQSTGSRRTAITVTPVTVLKQALELNRYVSKLDSSRMDKEGLHNYISEMIGADVAGKLAAFEEPAIKKEIILSLINSCELLSVEQLDRLIPLFKKISMDPAVLSSIAATRMKLVNIASWNRYMPWVLSLIVAGICLLIYFLAN